MRKPRRSATEGSAAANPEEDVPAIPAEGGVEVASGVASMGEKRGTVTFKTFDDAIAALRGASQEEQS